MEEKVSIIVPVYNAAKFINETIDSVLAQTYGNFELILVDDCSKDNSMELMKAYTDERVKIYEQPENMGAWAARNRGLSEAKGRYIAFIDSDDIWKPEKLEREMKFMEEERASFVFMNYEFADESGKGLGKVVHVPHTFTYRQALNNTTIFTSTVLIDRKKVPDDLIRMPNIKSEDTATWWRILKSGVTAYGLDETLVLYRRSAGSLSSNKAEALKRIWRLYREIAGLSVISSAFHFCIWAFTAVMRRV